MAPTDHSDGQNGTVFSVSGPVIVAENMIGCAMYELVGTQDAMDIAEIDRKTQLTRCSLLCLV